MLELYDHLSELQNPRVSVSKFEILCIGKEFARFSLHISRSYIYIVNRSTGTTCLVISPRRWGLTRPQRKMPGLGYGTVAGRDRCAVRDHDEDGRPPRKLFSRASWYIFARDMIFSRCVRHPMYTHRNACTDTYGSISIRFDSLAAVPYLY